MPKGGHDETRSPGTGRQYPRRFCHPGWRWPYQVASPEGAGSHGLGKGEPNETWSWAYPKAKCTGSAGRDWRLYGSATIHTTGGDLIYKPAKDNPKEAYLSCVT
jgi:hypothetical protein